MAVVCLTSASGAPGVTTTAVALALNWPRPVVVAEADPAGGSAVLAGFLRGTTPYEAGMVDLALSPLGIDDALRETVRPLAPNVYLLAGTRSHAQATALRDVWEPLAVALADLDASGQDVIIDAGRLGMAGSPVPLITNADLTLLCLGSTLPAISAARSWSETARQPASGWRHPGLLVIGEGRPYVGSEISKALELPIISTIPEDAASAGVYHRGAPLPKRFEASPYLRGIRTAVQSIRAEISRTQLRLVEEGSR